MPLNSKSDLNAQNDNGETALHLACNQGGSLDVVRRLLAMGADPNKPDYAEILPLHICMSKYQLQAAKLLLDHGARVNLPHETKLLTPLHVAVQRRSVRMVQLLLRYGASVNVRDASDATPLYLAVQMGDEAVLSLLLRAKASLRKRYGKNQITVLHEACAYGRQECVKILLEAGVEVRMSFFLFFFYWEISVIGDGFRMLKYDCLDFRSVVRFSAMILSLAIENFFMSTNN